MKRSFKKVICLCLIISIMTIMGSFSSAEIKVPTLLRVGLYSTGINAAVPCFTVSAQKGLQLGYSCNNVFNLLFEEPTNNLITLRKDSFFSTANGVTKEYNPLAAVIPDGIKSGPFHIQIGVNYSDINVVSQQVQAYRLLGIPVYPVFVDQWQIWTGFYLDQATAQNDLTAVIKPKLTTDVVCTIVLPAQNRIVALSSNGDVALLFGSDVNKFQIHSKQENGLNLLKFNNKSNYRGDLEVRRLAASDMTIINILTIDQYLYGVVPSEIGASSHPEALKAQAVAARNYALCSLGKHAKYGYDVCPTTDCQVYKGYDYEAQEANKAVDDTTGKVITYEGKLVSAFFFSSSGGLTEDVKNVWGSSYPYLVSVEDKFESGKSYNYNWSVVKSANSIEQTLQGRSSDIGDILSVQITKTADSGRVTELIIAGTKGSRTYSKESARTVFSFSSQQYSISTDADTYFLGLNGTKVKAQLGSKNVMTEAGLKPIKTQNNCIIVIGANGVKKAIPAVPQNYTFTGKGWGHAVGMSQEGARGMAKAGFTYEQILTHYYTGSIIESCGPHL